MFSLPDECARLIISQCKFSSISMYYLSRQFYKYMKYEIFNEMVQKQVFYVDLHLIEQR